MSQIDPISSGDPTRNVFGSNRAEGPTQSETTAAKVSQIKLPVINQKTGLASRQITLLEDANELYKNIKKDWNALDPEELAEKIIDLENKVSFLTDTSPAVEKVRQQAEHLHFKFVFPVALEMDTSPSEKSMPVTFARAIYEAANKVFKTNSVQAFNGLNRIQKQEVLRFAAGGK